MAEAENEARKLRFEQAPPLPTTTEFSTVPSMRRAIVALDGGDFYRPAILLERLRWIARVRAAFDTRTAGLMSTKIEWRPSQNNRDARRAARELAEDWPHMMPSPQRKQLVWWGLGLGVALAQRAYMASPTAERTLFRVRPYWPGWARWDSNEDRYEIETRGGKRASAKSPCENLTGSDPFSSPWIIHEPFGEFSYRDGLLHAVWESGFLHRQSFRDLGRGSEKHGIGQQVLEYPNSEAALAKSIVADARSAGREAMVAMPQFAEVDGVKKPGFSLKPFEFTGGAGSQLILEGLNITSIAFAIVLLGHNLTTEVKGGAYAAAEIGNDIRIDKKVDDADAESSTARPQLLMPWAEANYGDPELAPIANYVVDPPALNQARAATLAQLSQALNQFSEETGVNKRAICEQFQLPMNPETQVVVPKKIEADPKPEPATDNEEPAEDDASEEPIE